MGSVFVQLGVCLFLVMSSEAGTPPKVCLVSESGLVRTPDESSQLDPSTDTILTQTTTYPAPCGVSISVRTNKFNDITMAEVKVGQHPQNANSYNRRWVFDVFSKIGVFRSGSGLGPLAEVSIPHKDADNDRFEVRIRALEGEEDGLEGWKMVIFCDGIKFAWFRYKKSEKKYVRIRVRDPASWTQPCWD